MANYNELKTRARVIQNETQDGQNTAYRVGSLFYDIIAALAAIDGEGGGGSTIPSITAAATVNNNIGTPYVNVTKSGTDAAPRFTFNFGNLKGATGAAGATGPQGPQGVKGDPGEGIDAETVKHIEDLEKDLEDLMDNLDTEMEEKVKDLFKDAEFLEELFPDGGGGYSNFGQALNDYTDKYLQIIGMWEEDPTTHQKVYKWSKIQQEYNQIQSRVATLETVAGFPDSYEALVADLIQSIKDDEAFVELMTGYATVQDVNNVKTVVEWLYSGLRNSTTPDRTISEIVSAGKSALGGAIADVRTYVEKLKSGDYVAKASLAAALTDNNNKVLSDAGVLFTAGLDNSLGTFFAKSSGNTASISALANKLGSIIEVQADNIILDGTTWADIINFNSLLSNALSSSVQATNPLYGTKIDNSSIELFATDMGYTNRRKYLEMSPTALHIADLDTNVSFDVDTSTETISIADMPLTTNSQIIVNNSNYGSITLDDIGITAKKNANTTIFYVNLNNEIVGVNGTFNVSDNTELSGDLEVGGSLYVNSSSDRYAGITGSHAIATGMYLNFVNGVLVNAGPNKLF